MNKDIYFFYDKKHKTWRHRSPIKLIVNPILRKLQFWTDKPLVICTYTEFINDRPHFLSYGFKRIKYLKK